jgi:hypothetical protein
MNKVKVLRLGASDTWKIEKLFALCKKSLHGNENLVFETMTMLVNTNERILAFFPSRIASRALYNTKSILNASRLP